MESNDTKSKKKIVICVSGAADVTHCGPGVLETARELGRQVAGQGCILTTGATSGFPHASALAYQESKGFLSLGLSPATDEREHTDIYFLPPDGCDVTIYTGFGFPMRDIILTKSCDAMVIGCGRIGTIHEFTVAFESNIPIGILEGAWTTDEVIRDIIRNSNRTNPKIIFDSNPKRIIERLIDMARENKDRRELGDVEMFQEIKAKV